MERELVGFFVVAGLLIVTPGADTMFVLGRALRRGRGDAFKGSCGVGGAAFHVALSWCWLSGLAVVGSRAGQRLRPMVRRRLEAIGGLFLVAFGVRVASVRG